MDWRTEEAKDSIRLLLYGTGGGKDARTASVFRIHEAW